MLPAPAPTRIPLGPAGVPPTPGPNDPGLPATPGLVRGVGLLVGLLAFGLLLLLPPPPGLDLPAWRTAAVAVLMATWWMTEALPIPATALLPVLLFPPLGVAGAAATTAPYANPIVFLFLGGFLLARGMERWGLHRRLALAVIACVGTTPRRLVLGFMLAAALLSLWISNTATALMMLPIALSVVELARRGGAATDRFAVVLLLGMAYACSIGGLGTLIGTPTNALLAAFVLERYGMAIGFASWMVVGLPLAALGLSVTYGVLVRRDLGLTRLPGGAEHVAAERRALGRMSRGERIVAAVFGGVALLWATRPLLAPALPGLSDTGIALAGALVLFAAPVDLRRGVFALDWATARDLPWGVLLLFGGGLSLAAAIADTGLASWIGEGLAALDTWPTVALVGLVVLLIVVLTELTSNTATAAAFLPVLGAVALSADLNPVLLLVPATVAASCAFMLPVATPPNAIVFGSGYVRISDMMRAGLWLNLAFVGLVTLFAVLVLPLLAPLVLPVLTP